MTNLKMWPHHKFINCEKAEKEKSQCTGPLSFRVSLENF